MPRWRVGVDTGGTFTDLVAVSGDEERSSKVASTPPDYEQGVLDALSAADLAIADIETLSHGTTVATNAVIMQAGAPTALLTTEGFRDLLELRRHNRGDPFDIYWDSPKPLIPRRFRYEIPERVNYAGEVVRPLAEDEVRSVVRSAVSSGIRSFAVCYLNSYVNPVHEEQTVEIIRVESPTAVVSHSAELLREPPEFERTSTTVVNAYLAPVVSGYLKSLQSRLVAEGFVGQLYIMHSGGGLLTVESAVRFPARLLTSGPAGGAKAAEGVSESSVASLGASGVVAAEAISRVGGLDEVISLDIGGTSADIAVILGGEAKLVHEFSPQFGQPVRFPAVDLITIGAGGGSIAWVDAGHLPHVGPQSAGAVPGPAAYNRGGIEPTATDANLVLGRLAENVDLASGIRLDLSAATEAVGRFAEPLGLGIEEAALGIVDIANNNMAKSIRIVTVQRGLDPRGFTLVPFGGAGPLFAAELSEILGISRIVVPVSPGVTSALGCLYTDITHDSSESHIVPLDDADHGVLQGIFDRLDVEMRQRLSDEGVDKQRQRLSFSIDLRYLGQVRALTITLDSARVSERFREEFRAYFLEEYERQFHSVSTEIPIEVAALRVRGIRVSEQPHIPFVGGTSEFPIRERTVVTRRGPVSARVIERFRIPIGTSLEGPLVLTQVDSTIWIPVDWRLEVERHGSLRMVHEV